MRSFEDNLQMNYIKYPEDKNEVISILQDLKQLKVYKNTKKIEYYNISCAFDIETTSFFKKDDINISTKKWASLDEKSQSEYEKVAIMYIWQMGINGRCIIGRTWDEFIDLICLISEELELNNDKRIIVYVHNLAFEFQFIKNYFSWDSIFATKPYMPLYTVTSSGIEFRCSYRNTNKSLDALGREDILKYNIRKASGNLDYDLLRHSETALTDEELLYCINDIKVVMCYIQEQIEIEKKVDKIPLTKTGYVRRDTKEECFYDKADPKKTKLKRYIYRSMISKLTLDPTTYVYTRHATQGGFTHSNALYVGDVLEDIDGIDIASAYPAEILSNMFPMSAPKKRYIKNIQELEMYCNVYCCIFTIELTNVECVYPFDAYISRSRCHYISNPSINNGRVKSADKLQITITNVDYQIIKRWYTYDKIKVKDFYTFYKDYLPKPIIESTLKYYEKKTKLKGIKGSESEYMLNKGMLNSIFGMMLTNIVNPEIELDSDGSWSVKDKVLEDSIEEYNTNKGRFLYYPWGTFITAYVRRAIITGIEECGIDYVYTDTDSIKMLNFQDHQSYFKKYNEMKIKDIEKCLKYHKIDPERCRPENNKGEKQQIGIFDYEGHYKKFKTLGAKRYMYEDDKGIHITIAGLSKKEGLDYLINNFEDPFKAFTDRLSVHANDTGKNTHTYIDNERNGFLMDYQGKQAYYEQRSAVHLAPCPFSIKIEADFISLIKSLKMVNYNINLL